MSVRPDDVAGNGAFFPVHCLFHSIEVVDECGNLPFFHIEQQDPQSMNNAEQVFGDGESLKKKTLTAPVVIMADGKCTRLEPFTKVLPKPLVSIHEK